MSATRLFCGTCGKSCGRVANIDGRWWYIGQMVLPATDDLPRAKSQTRRPLAFNDGNTSDGDGVAGILVTCASGHHLHLEADQIRPKLRSGAPRVVLS